MSLPAVSRMPILFALALGACERGPTPHGVEPGPGSASPAVPASAALASATPAPAAPLSAAPVATGTSSQAPAAVAAPLASASATAPAGASAPGVGAAAGEPSAEPSLLDAEGKPLPQTEERPRVDGAAFKRRIEVLADAIVSDDPARARPAFFPVIAYEQVKAVAKPARDWEYRLVRAFERNIHEYHRALGPDAARAKFVGVSVDEAAARFMKPGSEGNRLGYYRVLRSRLDFERADGKRQSFELTSLISWRGEWYVVHLHGFE